MSELTQAMGADGQRPDDPISALQRWELFGGFWRVTARDGPRICISLCRCDNGEVAHRIVSDAPALDVWLDGRTSNQPRQP